MRGSPVRPSAEEADSEQNRPGEESSDLSSEEIAVMLEARWGPEIRRLAHTLAFRIILIAVRSRPRYLTARQTPYNDVC